MRTTTLSQAAAQALLAYVKLTGAEMDKALRAMRRRRRKADKPRGIRAVHPVAKGTRFAAIDAPSQFPCQAATVQAFWRVTKCQNCGGTGRDPLLPELLCPGRERLGRSLKRLLYVPCSHGSTGRPPSLRRPVHERDWYMRSEDGLRLLPRLYRRAGRPKVKIVVTDAAGNELAVISGRCAGRMHRWSHGQPGKTFCLECNKIKGSHTK